MNITPPMDPNAAPLDAIHKSRLISIIGGIGVLFLLWMGISVAFNSGLALICFVLAAALLLYLLFFDIQRIEFFPAFLSIKYILRKRLIERGDIDFVSLETHTSRSGRYPVTSNYVCVKFRNGSKIDLSGFRQDIHTVYGKLKAYESTNEQFLKGR